MDADKIEIELRSNIISLLRGNTGIGIEYFGLLSIDEVEGGKRYRVINQEDDTKELSEGDEYFFVNVKKAVDFFLGLRKSRGLGFDLAKSS